MELKKKFKEDEVYFFINVSDLIVLDEEEVNTCIQENIQQTIQNVARQHGIEVHGIIHNNDCILRGGGGVQSLNDPL